MLFLLLTESQRTTLRWRAGAPACGAAERMVVVTADFDLARFSDFLPGSDSEEIRRSPRGSARDHEGRAQLAPALVRPPTGLEPLANSGFRAGLLPLTPTPRTRSPHRTDPATRRPAFRQGHEMMSTGKQNPQFDVQYYQMIASNNPQLVVPRPLSGMGGQPSVVQVPLTDRPRSLELPPMPPTGAVGRTIDGHLVGPDGNRWNPEGGEAGAVSRSARRVAVPGWFKQEASNNGSIYAAETSYSTLNVLPGLPSCFSRATGGGGASSSRTHDETRTEHASGGWTLRLQPEENTQLKLTFTPEVRACPLPSPVSLSTAHRLIVPHVRYGFVSHAYPHSFVEHTCLLMTPSLVTRMHQVKTAVSLDEAVAEAKEKLEGKSEIGMKLIDQAVAKQQENAREFARCIAMREERLSVFMRSEAIATVLRRIYVAISTTSQAKSGGYLSAPRRGNFLSLHLTLVREGFLDQSQVGALLATYPYCYAPPTWLDYVMTDHGAGGAAAPAAAPSPSSEMSGGGDFLLDEFKAEHWSKDTAELGPLACWDAAQLGWRMLLARGGVKRFALTLTFEALRRLVFEMTDAHLIYAKRDLLRPFPQGDVRASLQDYLSFACKLAEACLIPVDSSGGGGSGGAGFSGGAGGDADGSDVMAEPEKPTINKPPPASERLKHIWPSCDAYYSELLRKHAFLRAGVREHQGGTLDMASAGKEFRAMCRLVLAFGKTTKRGARPHLPLSNETPAPPLALSSPSLCRLYCLLCISLSPPRPAAPPSPSQPTLVA